MTIKFPTVLCELASDRAWQFWCPFCHEYHIYGGGPDGTDLGHRAAHCRESTSPFLATGYVLMPRLKARKSTPQKVAP
jgi:hypothetical protein